MATEYYNANSSSLSWVRGNDVPLMVRVYELFLNLKGKTEERGLDITVYDSVIVIADSGDYRRRVTHKLVPKEANALLVQIPYDFPKGKYSLEIQLRDSNGVHVRSFGAAFEIVETNGESRGVLGIVGVSRSASVKVTMKVITNAVAYRETAYDKWKKLPGNAEKTFDDFFSELLAIKGDAEKAIEDVLAASEMSFADINGINNLRVVTANDVAELFNEIFNE